SRPALRGLSVDVFPRVETLRFTRHPGGMMRTFMPALFLKEHALMNQEPSLNPHRREAFRISMATAGWAALSLSGAALGTEDEKAKAAGVRAKAEDVRSIESIVAAIYDVISGPPGDRDWDRMRSLFHPGARLIPCLATPQDRERGMTSSRVLTV